MKKILAVLIFFSVTQANAQSNIYIKIGDAQTKKSLLALPPMQFLGSPAATSNYQYLGSQLFNVIKNDIETAGFFQLVDKNAFLEDVEKTGLLPAPQIPNGFKYESWKGIADFLVKTGFSTVGDEITLDAYVYQPSKAQLIMGKKYKGKTNSLRRIAHTFANDLMESLTGTRGMYLSRIVVTSDRAGNQFKEVYIMDWDGENMTKVTNHRTVAVSPAWSPDGKKIAYTAYVQRAKTGKRNPDLFIYDISKDERWLASYKTGLNSGVAFMPDNRSILLTLSQNINPDIYQMTFDGKVLNKLTNGPVGAMNVEPSPSPDGSRVVFSSNRSGDATIYMMNIDGSNQKRIISVGKYNSSPAWSPDGSKITFAGFNEGHFDIYIMNSDGSNLQKLTSARKSSGKYADNEDPVFAPDGQHIMFTSNRTGKYQIYLINTDGTNERHITKDNYNYFKPRLSKNIE